MREVVYSNRGGSREERASDVAKKKAAAKKPAKPSVSRTTAAPAETPPSEAAAAIAGDDPKPADASDGIGDDSPLVEGGELDPERAAMKREADELRAEIKRLELKLSKVDELDMAIIDAGIEVDDLEARISDLDKERKDLKEDLKKAVATLRACVIRRKTGQKELFTADELNGQAAAPVSQPPADVGAQAPISSLLAKTMKSIVGKEEFTAAKDRGEPIGMTDKQIEILEGLGWDTIGKMEKGINENAWWHRDIKGFGPDKIDRLTITLAAFRRKHPMPTEPESIDTAVGKVPQSTEPASVDTAESPAPISEETKAEAPEVLTNAIVNSDVEPWQKAVAKLGNLIQQAEAVALNASVEGVEFAESVMESATNMRAWVTEREHVTAEQETAIDNWAEGIAKWQSQN